MKKIIALILAVIMTFSITTVAFAEGEADDTTAPETSDVTTEGAEDEAEEAGDFDWLLDLPFWTVGPAFKFAKIALKLAKVVVKLGVIFGLIDKDDIIGQITDMINGAQNGETEEEVTEPVVETTATKAALA